MSKIRIVLVGTTHPGNIGAAARAMKNMGLTDLALVAPRIFPAEEAFARASGADDLLNDAKVHATVEEAIADCHRIVGASARLRSVRWPQLNPRESAEMIVADQGANKTAILFGREHAGLTNEELAHCHYLLHIPCDPSFSSLNVAAAVQVVTYEIYQARIKTNQSEADVLDLASNAEMESFHGHLVETLFDIGFLHGRKSSPALLQKLRRIFNRATLEKTDIHILRGILSTVQHRLKRP